MTEKPTMARRWQDLQASKTQLFWACAACIAGTLILGFTWGGWVTGSTAGKMASTAALGARAELAAAVCAQRFAEAPDAKAKLASLKEASSYQRSDIIEKAGWVTMIDSGKPVEGAAVLCVQQLMNPPVKSPG